MLAGYPQLHVFQDMFQCSAENSLVYQGIVSLDLPVLSCIQIVGLGLTGPCTGGCRMVLEGPLFQEYFKKVEVSNFEVASDAFQTFKDLLTRHEPLVASYLQSHYDEVSPMHLSSITTSQL